MARTTRFASFGCSRAAVTEEMRAALADDPVQTVIHGFTSLGLMELTRKKTEESQ